MQTATIDAPPSDFGVLALQIREAGLLNRRRGYYGAKIGITIAVFAAGWAALVIVGNSWVALGVAAFLGVMFTQLGFVGHDAGHQQVFHSRRANQLLGLTVGNALIGMSFGWWVPKHSAHHAHPNEVDRDPDMGDGIVSPSAGGFGRFLARWQAALFFPLMLLRSTGLHVSGIQRLIRQRDRRAAMEAVLITMHLALFFTVVLLVLSPLKALAFIAVQQAVFSVYLGCSFAPNHKGMPVVDGDAEMSFVRRQVITARNISRWPVHQSPARRPQLPDRTPSLPFNAQAEFGTCPGHHPGLLCRERPRLLREQPGWFVPPDRPPPERHGDGHRTHLGWPSGPCAPFGPVAPVYRQTSCDPRCPFGLGTQPNR